MTSVFTGQLMQPSEAQSGVQGKNLPSVTSTLWHMVSSFVARVGANQQVLSELLLCAPSKQPRDGGGVGAGRQCSLFLPCAVWPKAVGLAHYMTTRASSLLPNRALRGVCCVPCALQKCMTNRKCRHRCSPQHTHPHGVTAARCSKAGLSLSWLPCVI